MSTQLLHASGPVSVPSPGGAECRVYERKECAFETSCKPAAAGEMKWGAVIRDVSLSGVRLHLKRRFEPGSGLALELPDRDGQEKYTVLAKVVHVKPAGDGTWYLGCRFISELNEDELNRLVGPPPEAPPSAEPGVVTQVGLRIESYQGGAVRCRIRRLRVPPTWPFAAGKTVELRGAARSGSRWAIRVKVTACEPEGEGWAVRCRLLAASSAVEVRNTLLRGPAAVR